MSTFINSIRTIEKEDYDRGYKELFETLSVCEELSRESFETILEERRIQGWHTWVLEDIVDQKRKIIATTSLMFERKFYRSGKWVGHIEDVIVLKEYQHHHLGTHLNEYAMQVAFEKGCYKVILDCKESLEPFYGLAGFRKSNIQMAKYFMVQ